jgi:coenzyme F420-dependent glucose-6-phosphate dehydrogenase
MALIGFHASHELFSPGQLLSYVAMAERHGFAGVMCSDHFHPWLPTQGQSGSAWTWLGAALQATSVPFGVVTAPGQRYHPAIIAQASMTLAAMFPDRFWLAVGSGEALNEHITSDSWPDRKIRNARLRESVDVIRALWRGDLVSHSGLVRVDRARLYTRAPAPPVYGAALTPETAEWLGGWADGLLTAGVTAEALRANVEAFHRGGGKGKPLLLQAALSWAQREEDAVESAWRSWRHAVLDPDALSSIATPEEFEAASRDARAEDLRSRLHISSSLDAHVQWIREAVDVGFDGIYLHQVGDDQPRFIDAFGSQVLPRLGGRREPARSPSS